MVLNGAPRPLQNGISAPRRRHHSYQNPMSDPQEMISNHFSLFGFQAKGITSLSNHLKTISNHSKPFQIISHPFVSNPKQMMSNHYFKIIIIIIMVPPPGKHHSYLNPLTDPREIISNHFPLFCVQPRGNDFKPFF